MFAGYITRWGDNYPAPVLVAWELTPQHFLPKKTWWLPSHPRLEEVLAQRHTLRSLPRLLVGCSTKTPFLSSAAFRWCDPGASVSTRRPFDRVTEIL